MRRSESLKGDSTMTVDSFDIEPSTRPPTSSRLVQWALQDVVQEAKQNDKLVYGVHSAAEELESSYSEMLLCVLVVNAHVDPGTQIHCRLIDSFCWDVGIPVLKVNSSRKLKQLVGTSVASPVHCLLVKDLGKKSRSLETIYGFLRSSPEAFLKIL